MNQRLNIFEGFFRYILPLSFPEGLCQFSNSVAVYQNLCFTHTQKRTVIFKVIFQFDVFFSSSCLLLLLLLLRFSFQFFICVLTIFILHIFVHFLFISFVHFYRAIQHCLVNIMCNVMILSSILT